MQDQSCEWYLWSDHTLTLPRHSLSELASKTSYAANAQCSIYGRTSTVHFVSSLIGMFPCQVPSLSCTLMLPFTIGYFVCNLLYATVLCGGNNYDSSLFKLYNGFWFSIEGGCVVNTDGMMS